MNTRTRITLSLAAIVLIIAVRVVAIYWRPDGAATHAAPSLVAAAPAGTANVSLIPATASATAGEALTLTVQVQGAESLGGWELRLAFDPVYVELEAVTPGAFLASPPRTTGALGPSSAGDAGHWMMGGYSYGSEAGVTGDGALAYLRLRPLAEGQVSLTLDQLQLAAVQGTQVEVQPSTAQTGQLTITAPRLVSGNRQGSDVVLTWQHDSQYTGYEVWQHTAPYFAAGAPATLIATGLPPAPNCTQNGATITCADPGVIGGGQGSHFYVIRGIRPSGTRVSFNRLGQFDFAAQPGQ
ncbi:MAG: cohesin domain-containing protein [Chloroflexi bacterium]|nr:cohesin domain-containing protein [Chloroflexota bacterium]